MGQIFRYQDLLNEPAKFFSTAARSCIVDTNYLVGLSVPGHSFFSQASQIFKLLAIHKVAIYSNVNTRAEFLDVYRRLLLTKRLLDLENQLAEVHLTRSAQDLITELMTLLQESNEITDLLARLEKSVKEKKLPDEANDLFGELFERFKFDKKEPSPLFILPDAKIKNIRASFPPLTASGKTGWDTFCKDGLNGEIEGAWQRLQKATQITFVEVKENETNEVINKYLTWETLTKIMEQTGGSSYDSMIINFFSSSTISTMISADIDIAYAVRFSLSDEKKVVIPDRLYSELKQRGYLRR